MAEEQLEPQNDLVQVTREQSGDLLSRGVAEARKLVQHQDQRLLESVNGAKALKLRQPWTPGAFPERSVLGYEKGKSKQVRMVEVDGHLIEKYAAYDFLLMRRAASKAGVYLGITSAYRSYAHQERIYNQRYTDGQLNAVGRKKGPAAKPGFSNHQMGKALDLKVNLSWDEYFSGAITAEFAWLRANAALYGYDWVEGEKAREPWHWTHKEDRVVAAGEDEETYQNLVNVGLAAPLAVDDGRTNLSLYLGRDLHDRTNAWYQSLQMSSTTRSGIFAAQGEHAVSRASSTANYLAQLQQVDAVANRERRGFDKPTLSPLEYDFESGTWGDKGVV